MQLADEIGVKNLEAYGDSKLIVSQVRGEYEVRHEDSTLSQRNYPHDREVHELLH